MLTKYFKQFFPLLVVTLLAACASIGTPDGGPLDVTPPRMLRAWPENQSVNANKKKLSILFDEYIKLEGANEKLVVSPPQAETPNIRAEGKRIRIDLYDTLRSNTTYTIDFADAIVDNNEGNPLGLFTYSFATGPTIDTLEVSGNVLRADNLEPIKGILVGLHTDLADSAFVTQPFVRVSRTNGSGRFTIKGVAPGKYRLYALKDADGNFLFNQKSELIAFDTTVIVPSCRPDIRQDTIWHDSIHYDSIRTVHYTHYLPDDIILKAFLEEGQERHLLKTERPVPERFTVFFTAPDDSLPRIKGLNFNAENAFIVEKSLQADTLTFWMPDTTLAYRDSLQIELSYRETDSLQQLVWRTDTLDLVPKVTRAKQLKDQLRQQEKWEKEQRKLMRRRKNKNAQIPQNPYTNKSLAMQIQPGGVMDPNQNLTIKFDEPIAKIDTSALHFQIKKDTTWIDAPFLFLPHEEQLRSYVLYAEWRPKQQYRFLADSAAFTNIYGLTNSEETHPIRVRSLDDYSSLFIHLELADTGAVVELLNTTDKVVRTQRTRNNRAEFYFVKPGKYYLRTYIDANGNNRWDTGEYSSGKQPEEMFYFPRQLELRAKWEVEQDWDVRGIPTLQQKPKAITKQKPDKVKQVRNRDNERSEEMRRYQ